MRFKELVSLRPLLFCLACLAAISAAQLASADEITLQDNKLLVSFDRDSGALTRLEDKSTHWVIERRPALGVSFRLHAPLPNQRDNFVLGEKQRATEVRKLSDHQLLVVWKNLASEHGGVLPITFTATITLQDGALTFAGTLRNDSSLWVESLDYPYFGDLNPPAPNASLRVRTMRYDNLLTDEIYPHFVNEKGYWGDFYPTKTIDSSYSLFSLIQAPHQGLYVEFRDPNPRYLLQFTFEERPGVVDSVSNSVLGVDEISGLPVRLHFRTCHFIFAHPNSTTELIPVVLRPYEGDWHAGVDLHKQWRATWFRAPVFPDWVNQVHSWQQLQINSPEEDYRVPYRDLVKYGEEDAANGVTAIQLVGWNRGGQDRGNPAQDTDPHLGSWQELHDAIAQIQAKGVKIVLFAKFPWADMTTDWYKRELYKYAVTDPYGIPYRNNGYSYFTPTQLAGINSRPFAIMDLLSPAYTNIATGEFEKLLKLGSAGWLYDEVCVVPVKYNFASGHGYTAPGYVFSGQLPFSAKLRAAADKLRAEFLFAGEGPQDWLTQYYMSYFRIDATSTPVERYIDPHAPLMVAVTGFDDREKLNLILMDRYIISYEAYNFKGHVTDFPLTLAYGKKIDALRRKFKTYLWDAEFRDTVGVTVDADGAHRYSVFETKTGKRAVVVVNAEQQRSVTAEVHLPNPGPLVVATPEQPDAQPTTGTLTIPPRSVAVVMEQ